MSHIARTLLIMVFLAVLAFPNHAIAQTTPRYTLIDLGTLGGPNSAPSTPGHTLSDSGAIGLSAEIPAISPRPQTCIAPAPGCHVPDAAIWQNGILTDYGTLGGYNGGIFEVNAKGVGVGIGELGPLDPQTNSPEAHAAITGEGHLIDLGTLGGNESWAQGINSRGQVAGEATNTTPDPFALNSLPYQSATQWHAALWQNGVVHDLGTLGGPDSFSCCINERGQIAGQSFTSYTPNAVTGAPPLDPFLWQNGSMRDLGSLGGASSSVNWMNSRGEVVGQSDLAGDQTAHPFLWNGSHLLDLGTLGGNGGLADWINDSGQVIGAADLPGSKSHHGFLWSNGRMTDLPPTGGAPCSNAYVINASGQVVGNSTDCHGNAQNALLWENGQAIDLNTVIAPSPFHLYEGIYINDRGEIAAFGMLPNGAFHVVVLEPQRRTTAAQGSLDMAGATGASASFTVRFDSTVAGQGQVLFGSGPGCSGLVETATQDQGAGTTSHTIQVQGNELPGTVGDNGIVPGATYWYEAVTMTASGKEVDDNGGKCYSITIPGT